MKKILLLALVVLGGVMQTNAQITESGKIKVYFQNNNNWTNVYLYVKGNDSNSTEIHSWPGTNITSNTVSIDGNNYYYYVVDLSTLNGSTSITINLNDGVSNQSYDWGNITYDVFFSIANTAKETGEWNKYDLTRETKYYLYDTSSKISTKLNLNSGTTYSADIDNSSSSTIKYCVVAANDEGFGYSNEISDWSKVWRPWDAYNSELGLVTIALSANNCFYGSGENSWKFSSGINYTFSIDTNKDGTNSKFGLDSYFERTITDTYSTFSSDYAVAIPNGLNAYYVASASSGQVNMTKFNSGISSTDGAFLQVVTASSDNKYKFTPASSTDDPTTNLLLPTTEENIAANNYVFASGSNGLGFYKLGTALSGVGKGKAYLAAGEYGSRLSIVFGGEASGINETTMGISNTDNCFDLQGRRVAQPTKGLYIVNGKKVIMK